MFHFQARLCSYFVSWNPQPEKMADTVRCAWQKVQCVSLFQVWRIQVLLPISKIHSWLQESAQ